MLLAIKRVLRAAHLAFCGRARQLEFSRVPSLRQWQSFCSYSSSLLQKLHCTLYYFTPPYSQSKPAGCGKLLRMPGNALFIRFAGGVFQSPDYLLKLCFSSTIWFKPSAWLASSNAVGKAIIQGAKSIVGWALSTDHIWPKVTFA